MEYINRIEKLNIDNKTAVTLGKFDGVHIGHQELLNHVMSKQKEGFRSVLFTFDRPVGAFLRDKEINVLLTKEERHEVFGRYSLDYVIECEFTKELAHMSAEAFIKEVLVGKLNVGYIAVGTDFTFGYKARGNYQLLQEFAKEYGYEVEVVEKLTYKGEEVSSTRIRECIEKGQMEDANQMLGFTYPVMGNVLHGKKLGRTLGMPTTNLIPDKDKLLPPFGVYVSRTVIDGEIYDGITNIGCKPTVSSEMIRGVETFIFDYSGDLYGKTIEIQLLIFERPELKFDSVSQLKEEMDKDIVYAKKYLVDNRI